MRAAAGALAGLLLAGSAAAAEGEDGGLDWPGTCRSLCRTAIERHPGFLERPTLGAINDGCGTPRPAYYARFTVEAGAGRPQTGVAQCRFPYLTDGLTTLPDALGPVVTVAFDWETAAETADLSPREAYLAGVAALVDRYGEGAGTPALTFRRVRTERKVEDGRDVLVVEGEIANFSPIRRRVPAIRVDFRDAAGESLRVATRAPRRRVLAPGESQAFRLTLSDPPEGAAKVDLGFDWPEPAGGE